jgi:hypothetical protein
LIATSGSDAIDFTPNTDDCLVAHGGALTAGSSCRIDVTFAPSLVGAERATLVVTSDGGNPTSGLSGRGVTPQLTMAPRTQNAGGWQIGATGDPRPVTVTNVGTATATIQSLGMIGPNPGDFDLDSDGCMRGTVNGRLAPGASCSVTVTFSPVATGTRTASLVADSDGGDPSSRFSGLGAAVGAAAVSASPVQANLGGEQVGSSSDPAPITIRNTGGSTANIGDISIMGGNATDFTVDGEDCTKTHHGQLAPGEACNAWVTFTPTAQGQRASQLSVTSTGGTPTAPVTGTGIG